MKIINENTFVNFWTGHYLKKNGPEESRLFFPQKSSHLSGQKPTITTCTLAFPMVRGAGYVLTSQMSYDYMTTDFFEMLHHGCKFRSVEV